VYLRAFSPYLRRDGSCCRLVPTDVDYPFKIDAVSPSGKVTQLPLRRTGDRFVWAGQLVLREPGVWEILARNWGPRYSKVAGGRPRIRFRVYERRPFRGRRPFL
jgi:hypothetical protein